MKDRKGTEIKEGDKVGCFGLEFTIESFQNMKSGESLACGDYGCVNTDMLEKINKNSVQEKSNI